MTTDRDFDRITKAWLADGPEELADRVLDAVVDEIHLTPQRRAWRAPWRFPTMTFPARAATVAVIGALVIGGAVIVLGRPGQSTVGGPGATPSPSVAPPPSVAASPSAAAIVVPALTQTFTSSLHGYTLAYPAGWTVSSATQPWATGTTTLWGNPALDAIQTSDVRIVAASQKLASGQTPDEWLVAYCQTGGSSSSSCGPQIRIGNQIGVLDLDGSPAIGRAIAPGRSVVFDAAVVVSGRGYQFTMDGVLDRAYFQAFLDSVTFDPSAAIDTPPLTTTFTSPWYGYAIKTADVWTTTPATRHWVGTNNQEPAVDVVAISGTDSVIVVGSQPLTGTTFDAWLATYHASVTAAVPSGCDGGDPSTWKTAPIGSETGQYYELCNAAEAIIQVGGRVYVFTLGNATFDPAQHMSVPAFLAVLTTVRFDPAAAID